jgi:hypothetical protein
VRSGWYQAADAGDSEATALHFASSQLTITRFLGDHGQFTRQLGDALLVHVFEDRNNQTIWGINPHPMLMYFFSVSAGRLRTGAVEARHLLRAAATAFMMKTLG